MTPAQLIRNRRTAKGLTQAALAVALGIRGQYLQAWEHGRRNPSARSAAKLAAVLGGKMTDYLDLREYPHKQGRK